MKARSVTDRQAWAAIAHEVGVNLQQVFAQGPWVYLEVDHPTSAEALAAVAPTYGLTIVHDSGPSRAGSAFRLGVTLIP